MRIESERDQARCIEGLRRERGMGEGRRGASKLRNAARKMVVACGSFSKKQAIVDPVIITDPTTTSNATVLRASATHPKKQGRNISEIAEEAESSSSLATKNLCAICLDPLSYSSRNSSPGQAIFTAQCSHAFHFACISSNVRHGSVTCPICRAHWTQLPRNLNPPCSRSCNLQTDPVLQILDDSIATFRVHRRSFLRSARYDDDDPIEPYDHNPNHPRLIFSLVHAPSSHQSFQPSSVRPSWQVSYHPHGTSPLHNITSSGLLSQLPPAGNLAAIGQPPYQSASNRAFLSVKMAYQQATDLVLVASPNGPHLRLLKQCMSLAVFSLRSIDRLAIVAYSSAATRIFPLRRMTSYGKRAALQVIDRLFYMGQADPFEGLKKGLKILEDRAHKNPWSCILHMSDSPARPYCAMDMEVPIPIHRFHVGFGLGTSSGLVMHEFEEFLARMLGGVIRETQLWIGDQEGRMMVRLGEVRSGEERRIALNMQGEGRHIVYVGYSYIDGGLDECNITTGETLVGVHEKRETSADDYDDPEGTGRDGSIGGRTSSAEGWDYHDPHMARRWAKHLHGYRL